MPFHLFGKLISAIKRDGLATVSKKIIDKLSPNLIYQRHIYRKMLKIDDPKARFETIYAKNIWKSKESLSGTGSTEEATEGLRRALPGLFIKYGISKVLDVPCGDFNWMRLVMKTEDAISYLGGDILSSIIEQNKIIHASERINFEVIDLTSDKLPEADLIIVRDCLFHLSSEDVLKAKANIKRSNIRYCLITTHVTGEGFLNKDIITGDFRLINIFAEPFLFPSAPLERIPDFIYSEPEREMCLFEVASL